MTIKKIMVLMIDIDDDSDDWYWWWWLMIMIWLMTMTDGNFDDDDDHSSNFTGLRSFNKSWHSPDWKVNFLDKTEQQFLGCNWPGVFNYCTILTTITIATVKHYQINKCIIAIATVKHIDCKSNVIMVKCHHSNCQL